MLSWAPSAQPQPRLGFLLSYKDHRMAELIGLSLYCCWVSRLDGRLAPIFRGVAELPNESDYNRIKGKMAI
jgi:hypothetical protein